jgi:hypothetical protein
MLPIFFKAPARIAIAPAIMTIEMAPGAASSIAFAATTRIVIAPAIPRRPLAKFSQDIDPSIMIAVAIITRAADTTTKEPARSGRFSA